MSFVRAHGNFERRDNVKADENMVLSPLHFHCNYTIVLKCVRAFIYNDYSFSLANVAVSSIQSTPSLTLYSSMSAVVSSPIHISASESKLQSFPFCRCIVLLMSKFYSPFLGTLISALLQFLGILQQNSLLDGGIPH